MRNGIACDNNEFFSTSNAQPKIHGPAGPVLRNPGITPDTRQFDVGRARWAWINLSSNGYKQRTKYGRTRYQPGRLVPVLPVHVLMLPRVP